MSRILHNCKSTKQVKNGDPKFRTHDRPYLDIYSTFLGSALVIKVSFSCEKYNFLEKKHLETLVE